MPSLLAAWHCGCTWGRISNASLQLTSVLTSRMHTCPLYAMCLILCFRWEGGLGDAKALQEWILDKVGYAQHANPPHWSSDPLVLNTLRLQLALVFPPI
jgi:hypothetical protein